MTNVLIRDVPEPVRARIRREHQRRMVSQNAYLVSLLSDAVEQAAGPSLFDHIEEPAPQPVSCAVPFSFIDLFSGIGGLRLGLEAVGGDCVFSCEKDRYAQKTYHAWFGENPTGDVTELAESDDVPQHDVLAAGFPCQPFSIAGVSKKRALDVSTVSRTVHKGP